MIKASQQKIKIYAKFLRKKLLEEGYHKIYVSKMLDDEVLKEFRKCCDCEEEIITADQQMHAILEFDTPERTFEVSYENLDDCDDEDDITVDDESELVEINFICPDSDDIDFKCVNFDEDVYDAIDDYIEAEEDSEIIRGKWILDGASTLDEAIEACKDFIIYLKELKKDGYRLIEPVEGDFGLLEKDEAS